RQAGPQCRERLPRAGAAAHCVRFVVKTPERTTIVSQRPGIREMSVYSASPAEAGHFLFRVVRVPPIALSHLNKLQACEPVRSVSEQPPPERALPHIPA